MYLKQLALPGLLALLLAGALAACSSDADSPVGSEFVDDVLGTEPGTVYQDTIDVIADTVLAFNSLLANNTRLEVGRKDGYTRVAILRPNFSSTNGDENREVTSASLRMRLKSLSEGEDIVVRFYFLGTQYTEGDSVATLDTLGVIRDPVTGAADRVIEEANALNPLPPELVQAWIRGDTASNGIAVIYQDDGIARVGGFDSSEKNGTSDDPPTLQVEFSDLTSSSYRIGNDATFVRPTTTTSNLIVSDGYVRRIWFRIDTEQLSDSSAVHSARIRFQVVPGSASGIEQVELYIPGSTDVTSSAFLSGTLVTNTIFGAESEYLEFVITNTLLAVLSEKLPDNGFVMRFIGENARVRFIELYGSAAADSLAPRVVLTSSTPAEFDRE
jgi:hypothetical protein